MKLTLLNNYKSLIPFECELPDFTIITGINGAGKTHLLTGISSGAIVLESHEDISQIKYMSTLNLSPNDNLIITRDILRQKSDQLLGEYNNFLERLKTNSTYVISQFINSDQLAIIRQLIQQTGKGERDLTAADFHDYYPMDDGLSSSELIYYNFSILYKKYLDKFQMNKFKKFLQQDGQLDAVFLTDESFIEKWGQSPWDFLNQVNANANIDFVVNIPIVEDLEAPFEFKLRNKSSGVDVKFNELSSGEKAIISLAMALYNSQIESKFPKVLLLDEADASLHPSMAKHFLSMIHQIFVVQKGIKVIMSTHSPTTVALAPDETLHVVNRSEVPKVEFVSKDKALKILTEGVPSFSVNYQNRRQVFVESAFDVQYYESVYRIMTEHLNPEISLSFISSGDSRRDKNGQPVATCDQVIEITNILRKAGNRFVWGIIDYDDHHNSTDAIKVLGEGKRYSIENYLLDPILVAGLLLREKFISRSDIGLSEEENLMDFKSLPEVRLQKVCAFIEAQVVEYLKPTDKTSSEVILLDGRKIKIANWYLQHQGHTLEALLLKTFPRLAEIKKGKEEGLKMAILTKVVDDVKGLLSQDFLTTFLMIQD